MLIFLFSCNDIEQENSFNDLTGTLQTKSLSLMIDSLNQHEIIELPETGLKSSDVQLKGVNVNSTLWDIRGMDVNLVVKENSSSKRHLQSQGTGRELILAEKNNQDNQKFKLSFMPLTGYILIKNSLNNLLSVGVYSNAPDVRVLYAKSNDDTYGACWNFNEGNVREKSYVLENADALSQGDGGPWDVYYDE